MTAEETPASSNNDETTQAQTTTEALEWHAPVLVRIDEHTTIPHLLKERVQRGATRPLILRKIGIGDTWRSITAREFLPAAISGIHAWALRHRFVKFSWLRTVPLGVPVVPDV